MNPTSTPPLTSEQRPPKTPDRCHAIFENAPFGMCVIGMDMHFVEVNGALCRMLGYSAKELFEFSLPHIAHPNDLGSLRKEIEQLTQRPGDQREVEIRFSHRDGTVVWARMGISLLRDGSESLTGFVAHITDITERKRVTMALRKNEERFKAIADNCPSMMWETGHDGRIRFVNKACRRFLGLGEERMDGDSWHALIHPEDASECVAAFNHAIEECTPFKFETRIRRSDGEWRLLGSRAEPRFSADGEYLGHIGLSADITERIHLEQARQFELSLNRAIHSETILGILVVNCSGEIVTRNKRFLEIWGLSESDVAEKLSDIGIGPPDEPLLQRVLELVDGQEAFIKRICDLYDHPDEEDHSEIKLKDGRTLDRHSKGLRDQQGKYLGRVWFFRDITEARQFEVSIQCAKDMADEANRRLQADRAIIENERQMLHALIDNIPDFMYVKDLESRFVVANPYAARAVGMKTPEDLLGKTDFDFYPRELASAFYQDEQDVIHAGQPLYNLEERIIDRDGNEVNLLTTKVPIRDSDGRVIGIAGVGRNITERKKMENALKDAEEKYHGIFNNAAIGIFQSTPEGRFLSVNPAMSSTFGYDSPEEMIACITDISQQLYVNPKNREDLLSRLHAHEDVINFDFESFRKDRSRIWISLSARGVFQDGCVVRYEGMCEDITERTHLREQLLQAQKLESVGQLAAGIAHEINTPTQYIGDNVRFMKDAFLDMKRLLEQFERLLSSAKSNSLTPELTREIEEVVKRVDPDYLLEEIPKAVDQTLEGVQRVATIVSAMKEFSHPGTKEKVPVDLNHAIESTITVARNEWKYVAEMESEFDPELLPILCLPAEFNQVILNLIVNAAHAIGDVVGKEGHEKGKISVRTKSLPGWAEIRIQDTGSGIPESIRTRVFDPFFTTKGIGKGTGQGLAIARSVIVDKHGGTIHFETEPGKGTTFIIRLPRDGVTIVPKAAAA